MTLLALITFTDQGVRNIQNTVARASAFKESVEAAGGKVLTQLWCLGEFDGCVVFESPNDLTAAKLLLDLEKQGNVRTRTVHAFDNTEIASILGS